MMVPAANGWNARRVLGSLAYALLRLRIRPWRPRSGNTSLIIAPHPDDCALGCGGLIARRTSAGECVHIVYLTDGAASHPGHPVHNPATIAAQRAEEARHAAPILGVDPASLIFLGARDGTLPHLQPDEKSRLTSQLRETIMLVAPDEVFATARRDGSSEHSAAWYLVQQAIASLPGPAPRLYEYTVWARWSPRLRLRALFWSEPVYHQRLNRSELHRKLSAIASYRSQLLPLAPWLESVLPPDFVSMFKEPVEYYWSAH